MNNTKEKPYLVDRIFLFEKPNSFQYGSTILVILFYNFPIFF